MNLKDSLKTMKKSRIVSLYIMILLSLAFIFLRFCPIVVYSENNIISQFNLGISSNIDIFFIIIFLFLEIIFIFTKKRLFYILSLIFNLICILLTIFYGLICNYVIYYFLSILLLYLMNIVLIIVTKENF